MKPGNASGSRTILAPLVLTQFVASFAGSNMNVSINSIAKDLGTTVHGVQTAITLFLLCMAALMIPGSKLTDRWGRKRCLTTGLAIYGIGAVIGALAPGLGVLIVGYSGFEGVGSALMIPPIYILATLFYGDVRSRARAFGAISGAGGVGAAAGPLIGGLITSALSWRVSFLLQAAIVATVVVLSRRLDDPLPAEPTRRFDALGAILSASGMLFLVLGILQAGNNTALLIVFLALGAGLQLGFFLYVRREERAGKEPLLSTSLWRNRIANLALITQHIQWLVLMGSTFVVSVFLQVVKGYSAIKTGIIFTAATGGVLIASAVQERLAKRYAQRSLIVTGFVVTLIGIGLLLGLYKLTSSVWVFAPGLLLMGLGIGAMLTPSVNLVQSSFPEEKQGEISGLSRSVSNLGSSLGTAIAGTIVVADAAAGNSSYAAAMIVLCAIALIGLGAAILIPVDQAHARKRARSNQRSPDPQGLSQISDG
ncbi:MAG TPA: MFS transporter [Solirubrobacteraceae bacterium]|nr:MFS transporter [Solirubrobacteraceae bacterium]